MYRKKQHSTDFLFTFLLLIIFAIFALVLAGTGALVYQNSISSLDENYTSRTSIAYVAEKVRQYDSEGQVSLSSVEGLPALKLSSGAEAETATCTYIYYYDGSLCELYVREETTPAAAMGTALVELSDFTIEQDGSLLRVTAVSPEGETMTELIHTVDISI
ncbi:MAG: DUF4860 domain-containing protein [Lachnospiraceae bacterium]|nr:DUF4860 domain-containing protein [Lachnospiraceae bacterium]